MTKQIMGTKVINDVTVIYDGVKKNGRSTPLIVCPDCKEQRRVLSSTVSNLRCGTVTGLCRKCAAIASSKDRTGVLILNDDEVRPSGSIIHWGERERTGNINVPVTCGLCKEKRITTVVRSKEWSSYCIPCVTKLNSRKNHPGWKGGKHLDKSGYVMLHTSTLDESEAKLAKSMCNKYGYVREHRLVVAKKLNRPLKRKEIVHHLNGIKDDNRPSNLETVTSNSHVETEKVTIDRLRAEIKRLQDLLDAAGLDF